MKDNSKLNQYCSTHRYVHNEAYELCDYCMEHTHDLRHRDKYYSYGFSKRKITICMDCDNEIFGRPGIVIAETVSNVYESICQAIKDKTTTQEQQQQVIDCYEAVRIAYSKNTQYFIEYFGNDIFVNDINKNFEELWRFTYRFVNEEQRIKVVNRDPDNLLVSWVPGYYTELDIPKSMLV